jgi:uroporphyrinogen decarboxylase
VAQWKVRDCPLCLLTNGTFGFYSMMRRLMGTENACIAFFDHPAMVHDMVAFFADFFIELTTPALKQLDADYFNFFEDFAFKNGPLVSPRLFREFLLPGYKRVIGHLNRHGVKHIWLDSDGNTEVLIPMFIEMGVTCHWPVEIAADMDPVKLRKQYGKDLAIVGGIDKRELTRGKKEIERELDRHMRPMLETGGYVPTLDHTFPPDIPYENYCYYLELKQKIAEGR